MGEGGGVGATVEGGYVVRALSADELAGPLLDQAIASQAAALGLAGPDEPRIQARAPIVRRHTTYPGFRGFGAFDQAARRLVGFVYGYVSFPGGWWREQVCSALTPAQRRFWFDDAFEFVELHVRPEAQGHHLGSRLHDALLEGISQRTALLSTMHRSTTAHHLYFRRGWRTLVQEFHFSNDPTEPFSVLGLELSA